MANGLGISNGAGQKMAIQLSGLAADMASFYNTDYETTANALQGIFTNQTRALKQFGVVMNESTLEAFRLSRGIETAYSQMSEAQKVALRYNYVLNATANAQNDFARTSFTWANQMRQLSMNWNSLITTVGNGLIKILTPVVAILNRILQMAIMVVNAIAKVFGGEGISGINSGAGSGLNDIAAGADDAANNLGGATAAAKKFKATIAGFDELEILKGQDDDSGGGGGGAGGLGGGGISADDLDSYFDVFEESGMLNKFEDWMQKIKDMMDSDNWEGIGLEVASGLNYINKAIDDWIVNTFEPAGMTFASRVARVLNGLVEGYDWNLLGKMMGDGLNSLVHIANEFLDTFDALKLGEGIGTTISSWFSTVDWAGIGRLVANYFNELVDIIKGVVFNIDWETVRESITTALTNLWENLDVEDAKETITELVNQLMETLKTVDWYKIGHTVGEMLSGVDWLGVFKDLKDQVIWPAFKGFWDGLMSDGKNFLIGEVGKIKSWFSESFLGPIVAGILGAAGTFLTWNWIAGAARGFFKDGESLVPAFTNSLKWMVGRFGEIVEGMAPNFAGILQPIAQFFGKDLSGYFSTAAAELGENGLGSALMGVGDILSKMAGPIALVTAAIISLTESYGGLGGVLERVGKIFTDTWDNIKQWSDTIGLSDNIAKLGEAFGKLWDKLQALLSILGLLKPVWETLFTAISGAASIIGEIVVTVFDACVRAITGFIEYVDGVLGLFIDTITGIFTGDFSGLQEDIQEIWDGICDIFTGAIETIVGVVGGFIQGIIDFFADLKYNLIGDPIVIDMWDGIQEVFDKTIGVILDIVEGFVKGVINFFKDIFNKGKEIFNNLKTTLGNI